MLSLSARLTATALALLPALAFAWGFDGHRRLASKLHEPLPNGCLKTWLSVQTQATAFQEKSCDPDRWRSTTPNAYDPSCTGSCEAPHHYLNIDYANPITDYPRDWAAVQTRFGQYAVQNGQVPWHLERMYGELVTKFQSRDSAAVADHIAWMSHYVGDAFSPYHDTRYSDPKLSGSDTVGGHSRYESVMLDDNSTRIDNIASRANLYYGTIGRADAKNHIFDHIIVGNPLAAQIANADSQGGGDITALYNATSDLTARRWGDALTLMASLVMSAWVDAGKPVLTGMPSGCSNVEAQGAIVFRGYALPVTPDAGVLDGGAGAGGGNGGSAGGGGFNAGTGGGTGASADGAACGCSASTALWVLPALALLLLRRRRA